MFQKTNYTYEQETVISISAKLIPSSFELPKQESCRN